MKRLFFYMTAIITLLSILLIFHGCTAKNEGAGNPGNGRNRENSSNSRQNGGNKQPPVIEVSRTDIVQVLEETGEIAPEKRAVVKSRISGRVSEILVDEGDFISKGGVIARIEPDLEQAKVITSLVNSLKEKEINLSNIRDEYEQKKELFDKGFISRSEFQKAADALEIAEMDYNARLEEYTLFKSELGSEKNIAVEKLTIISPLAGIVLQKMVEEGELVSGESSSRSGTELFLIADLTKLVILVNINEVDIYKIEEGNKVDILIAANPKGNYTGVVLRISPYTIEERGIKVFQTEIMLDQNDPKLRPGMSAVVNITINAKENVIAIPVNALFIEENKEYVIIPTEKNGFAKVFVKRGINDDRNVEILEGLSEGDKIYRDIPFELLGKDGSSIPAYNMRKKL
ncbi:MAG: efflux RND transporter periplasmic adaptor subunit [Spirochaetales bacterium]|nr:efflux RND transporter periplasmic adaptor subunit [Spirochaetales bacterium]